MVSRVHILLLVAIPLTMTLAGFRIAAQSLPADCPERPADEDSRLALANTWFKKAEKAYSEKSYAESVSAFRCSLYMVEHPATYYNAAQAALMAEDKRSALEFFKRNLELAPDGDSAAEVELEIEDLEQELNAQAAPPVAPKPETTPEPAPEPEPEQRPEPEPQPEEGEGADPLAVTGIVLTGVGAAGVVAGAVLQGLAGKARSDSEEAEYLADFEDAEDRMNAMQKGAYVGFLAGGAILVTGVILLAVSGGEEEPGDAEVVLVPTPSGLSLTGRF